MNPTVINRDNQLLSQFTMGVLRDFGYEVDFSAGMFLTEDDVSDFSVECQCPGMSRPVKPKKRMRFIPGQDLSPGGLAMARASGLAYLAEQRALFEANGGDEALSKVDGVKFIGDKVVAVLVEENGRLHDVVVFADS